MNSLLTKEEFEKLQKQMEDPQKRLDILLYLSSIIDEFEDWYKMEKYKEQVQKKDNSMIARLMKFLMI
jgi:hypothetical protein